MLFGNSRYWLFQAIGWGGFALISVFFAYSFDQLNTREELVQVIGRIGIFVALGLILTHLMRLVIISLNLLQKKIGETITSIYHHHCLLFNYRLFFRYAAFN